jgi:hypothetical protein
MLMAGEEKKKTQGMNGEEIKCRIIRIAKAQPPIQTPRRVLDAGKYTKT